MPTSSMAAGVSLPCAVQVGERPRPVEQPLAELCRGERRGRAVRAGGGGDALPQRVGLLAQQPHELAPRRAVVERDEAHERQRHRGRGQDEERAAACGVTGRSLDHHAPARISRPARVSPAREDAGASGSWRHYGSARRPGGGSRARPPAGS